MAGPSPMPARIQGLPTIFVDLDTGVGDASQARAVCTVLDFWNHTQILGSERIHLVLVSQRA